MLMVQVRCYLKVILYSIMEVLHLILLLLLNISNFFIFFVRNPVYSLLFLILMFCETSIILFLLNVEFLGLIFILIYVGAIAILFLFMVMMLNIKFFFNYEFLIFNTIMLCLGIFICTCDIFDMDFFFADWSLYLNIFSFTLVDLDFFNNLELISQILYNNFLPCFLLVGLILLITLIGATFLAASLRKNEKKELFLRQITRSNLSLTFFNFEKVA